MCSPRILTLALVVIVGLVAVAPLSADVELLLKDGSTVNGTEVRLERGEYLLDQADGGRLVIPVELVRELRLLGSSRLHPGVIQDKPRTVAGEVQPNEPNENTGNSMLGGWVQGKPQNLSGPTTNFVPRSEQLAVFGEPSRFAQSSLNYNFIPVSGLDLSYDVLEASRSTWLRTSFQVIWNPPSVFDNKKDVLANSRSRWAGETDSEWLPEDRSVAAGQVAPTTIGDQFQKECGWCGDLPNGPSKFEPSDSKELDAQACAERIFDGRSTSKLAVEKVAGSLGLPIYLVEGESEDDPRALITLSDDLCRLIAGDISTLTGITLSDENALSYAVDAWNQALFGISRPVRNTPRQQLDFAIELIDRLDPNSSGSARSSWLMLEDGDDAERAVQETTNCDRSETFRKEQIETLKRRFMRPRFEYDDQMTEIYFLAWTDLEGELFRYDLRVAIDGRVSIARESISSHLGEHRDSD
jgi:hypothetical protein